MKSIKIACDTKLRIPFSELHWLQGELKSMSRDDFALLKQKIEAKGFTFALHVWRGDDDKWWIVDGHGRQGVIKHLVDIDGYDCPNLPCVQVEAASLEAAKDLILDSSSIYHRVTKQGLYEFLNGMGLEGVEMLDRLGEVNIPDISLPEFKMEFFDSPESGGVQVDQNLINEALDKFNNNTIKQIVLYYPNKEYSEIISKMDSLSGELGAEDFSQLIWRLVDEKSSARLNTN